MTREEIQKVLDLSLEYYKSEIFGTGKETEAPIPKRVDWIYERIKNYSPASNLDEAAEEYAPDFSNDFTSKAAVEAMRDAFKAGAEWMAGQGYTRECTVDRAPLNGPAGICMNLHEYTGFKIGDRVIVQIRKIDYCKNKDET